MIEFIGWIGVVSYLVAYALLGLGWLNAGILYHTLNAVGALCLVIFSYHIDAGPNLVVNLIWILIAIVSVGRIIIIQRKERHSSESQQQDGLPL